MPKAKPKPARLSHFTATGHAAMVDVGSKQPSRRTATASAFVVLSAKVMAALPANPKGNPLEVARIAGIQAAKRTAELIPMCHPLALTHIDVETKLTANGVHSGVHVRATAATFGQTGVEMEALTAAAVAALTVYDMTKALDKSIVIREIRLETKSGGKSGDYQREKSGTGKRGTRQGKTR
jgi:cyclic pyranopterin phosphate synthase